MHIFCSIRTRCLTRYRLIQVNLVLNHIPRRFHRCFPSDYQIRCCRGALRNLENQHTLVHTNTLIKRCTHTGKMQDHKTTKNYWATSTHPFDSLLFLCVCFFSVLWMVVSLGLYNCVYIIWVIYHFNFLSFWYFFWFVIALLYWSRAQRAKCMYLTRSLKKMVLQSVQL